MRTPGFSTNDPGDQAYPWQQRFIVDDGYLHRLLGSQPRTSFYVGGSERAVKAQAIGQTYCRSCILKHPVSAA